MLGMHRLCRRTQIVLGVVVVFLVCASPALALSRITNTFTRSDSTLNTGQKVTFVAKTVFGWEYVPNPYPSDFYTELNSNAFNKPVTTASLGIDKGWAYKSPGEFVNSAWYVASGQLWIVTTTTVSQNFSATAKSGWSSARAYHGQSNGNLISTGPGVYLNFTHN